MATPKDTKASPGGMKRHKSDPPIPDSPAKDSHIQQMGRRLERILAELKDIKLEVQKNSSKVDLMRADRTTLKNDLQVSITRVTQVESRASKQEDEVLTLRQSSKQLLDKGTALEKERTEAKDRNRRLNIRGWASTRGRSKIPAATSLKI